MKSIEGFGRSVLFVFATLLVMLTVSSVHAQQAVTSCSYTPAVVNVPYHGVSDPVAFAVTPSPASCVWYRNGVYDSTDMCMTNPSFTISWGEYGTGVDFWEIKATIGGPTLCSLRIINENPTAVPSLSEWAVIGLALLIAALGIRRVRLRQR